MFSWNAQSKNIEQVLINRRAYILQIFFQSKGGFVELQHFDEFDNFGAVFLDTLEATFWIKNLAKRWTQIRALFSNIGKRSKKNDLILIY